jgi:DnaJ-class molecular chaperone
MTDIEKARERCEMAMRINVYRGSNLLTKTTATAKEIQRGYTTIECPSCKGTGVFEITDTDSQDCVECSTKGELTVSI